MTFQRLSLDSSENSPQLPVGDEGHRKNKYLPDEIVLVGAPSSETFCRLQSAFNTSNHSRWKQLGPCENLLGGKSSNSCCSSPAYICFISIVYDLGPNLSVYAYLHYIMLPTFLCGTAIGPILMWLLLYFICFCLGYQHTHIFSYCILCITFAFSVCLNFTLG